MVKCTYKDIYYNIVTAKHYNCKFMNTELVK